MAVLQTVSTSRAIRPMMVDEQAPDLTLAGVSALAMLAMALAPTVFVLGAAARMLGAPL